MFPEDAVQRGSGWQGRRGSPRLSRAGLRLHGSVRAQGRVGSASVGAWQGPEVLGTVIIGELWKRSGWGHLTLCFVISASGFHKAFKEPLLGVPGIEELEAWIRLGSCPQGIYSPRVGGQQVNREKYHD